MTDDGGVAESMNVYLDNTECAPINEPISCHEDFGLSDETDEYEIIYIHKTQMHEIPIAKYQESSELYYVIDGEYNLLIDLGTYTFSQMNHIGNTLIITTDSKIFYLLYKNGEYVSIDLSEDILPKLSFVNRCVRPTNLGFEVGEAEPGTYYDHARYKNDTFAVYIQGGNESNGYKITDTDEKELLTQMWETYRQMIEHNLALGAFSETIMIRYALKLYDGSYLWASSPIMLGSCLPKLGDREFSGIDNFSTPVNAFAASDNDEKDTYTSIQVAAPYKVGVSIHRTEKLSALKDIITSIDVFMSVPVNLFPNGSSCVKCENLSSKVTPTGRWTTCMFYTFDPVNSEDPKNVEDAVLAASTFFLAKSYPIDNLPDDIDELYDDFRGENLFTKTQLDDSKVVTTIANASYMETYNSRLFMAGADEAFSRGIGVLNGQCANVYEEDSTDYDYTQLTYGFAYHFPHVGKVVKDYDAKTTFGSVPMGGDIGLSGKAYNTISEFTAVPYAWISHPNPKCTKVTVLIYSPGGGVPVSGRDIEMKQHPYLNCSYAFLGIGVRLATDDMSITSEKVDEFDAYDDSPIETYQNKLIISQMENPFVYSTSGEIMADSKILGIAIAASPISIGQFGQYPIYLFEESGVWSMAPNSDGLFSSNPILVTIETCSNVKSVVNVANSVFFMSKRGLLCIQGGDVRCVSEYMNGTPFVYTDKAKILIEGCEFGDYIDEGSYFQEFMSREDTYCAFDYEGSRLIYYNVANDFQYVYHIKTNTWHKALYGTLHRTLNTFPKCVVTTRELKRVGHLYHYEYGLLDLSISHDIQNTTPKKGIIATRPFDLDEPDVFKTITDVRVRGQFPKGAVRFILLGSNDGINFYTISTLRGKSWKLFRIIILADLDPTDRISWIDVQYETRFTNRLR